MPNKSMSGPTLFRTHRKCLRKSGGLCGDFSEADVCNSKLLSWSLVVVYGGRKLTHEKPIKLNDVENRTQKKLEMEIASCPLGKKLFDQFIKPAIADRCES